jgi:hypothetical protein
MTGLAPQPILAQVNDPKAIRTLRGSILGLILVLTFEGLARKINIHGTSVAIFLLKDFVVAFIGLQLLRLKRPQALDFLWLAYLVEIVLFLPVIVQTATNDPLLAIFGAKEYLLYPIVAFAVFIAFENATVQEITVFFRWLVLLIFPTTALALVQLHLPASHWLNLSVGGDSLEGFSAGGHLRVSSTFAFVAQYCCFINAEVFITIIALNNLQGVKWQSKMFYLLTVPLLIVSAYVTGSRGAVLINCLIIGLAGIFSLLKFQARSAFRIVGIAVGLLAILALAQYLLPDAFAAYSVRQNGEMIGVTSEIQERVYNAFFSWTQDAFTTPFLGRGLGIMSNGSETLSAYAAATREYSWTETDYATTLFEGGLYLMFIWYGFRFFVIYQVTRRFLFTSKNELSVPGAFCVGYVIVIGMTATLGIQPPIAIWWWFAVGTTLLLWWKCVEPKKDGNPPETLPQTPVQMGKLRGQSSYSERLHAHQ